MEKNNKAAETFDLLLNESGELDIPALSVEVLQSEEFGKKYAQFLKYYQALTAAKDQLNNEIKKVVEDNFYATGETSIECGEVKATYSPGSTREIFDSKKFKQDYPDMYRKYTKTSSSSGSLRVTIKEPGELSDEDDDK